MSERTWRMWAGLRDGQYFHVGDEFYAAAYGHAPVPVAVTEDPDGAYWGWLDSEGSVPEMIWPDEVLFRMCFTYGPEAEVAAGKGRVVHLNVKEAGV